MRDIAGYLQGFTFMDYSNVVIIPVPSSKGYKYSCIINAVKRIFHIMDNSINETASLVIKDTISFTSNPKANKNK